MAQGLDPYGAYQPPYALPKTGTGAGEGPYGSTPYIGGAGDPNAGRVSGWIDGNPGTVGPSPQGQPSGGYGDYLGWDKGKLNDPTHQTSKYQFLRAMLDAGIDPSKFGEKDPAGIAQMVAALNARGIGATAVPGSDDKLFWPGEGTFDAIDRSTTPGTPRFFFAQQSDVNGNPVGLAAQQAGAAPSGMPLPAFPYDPTQAHAGNPDKTMPQSLSGSSYGGAPLQLQPKQPGDYWSRQPYVPPYLNGAV